MLPLQTAETAEWTTITSGDPLTSKLRRKQRSRRWYNATDKLGWGGCSAWPLFYEESDYPSARHPHERDNSRSRRLAAASRSR